MTSTSTPTIPPASITGRIGKLLFGVFQLWGVISIVPHFAELRNGTWHAIDIESSSLTTAAAVRLVN